MPISNCCLHTVSELPSPDLGALKNTCRHIRYKLVEVSSQTKTPHLASCLSAVELLVGLYWTRLIHFPEMPTHPDRDYFLLGKGHAASLLYTVLAYRGFFEASRLLEHGSDDSPFEEHPGVHAPPGVEAVSGSLGHALSIAVGMAKAAKIRRLANHFFVLLGDGELNEGAIWEAAMVSAANKLDNLTVMIDFNKLQGTGRSCEIMALEPLEQKFIAFGWCVYRINGNNITEVVAALGATNKTCKPVAIIADTIKGAGVSFMEDDNNWHYRIPTQEELIDVSEELGLA